jgi:hypothetical protein
MPGTQNASGKKKGRVRKRRALKPTSNGNCSSWNFIVGKKGSAYIRRWGQQRSLQVSNMEVINNLSTRSVDEVLNNLWAICGPPVDCTVEYRIVKMQASFMHQVVA